MAIGDIEAIDKLQEELRRQSFRPAKPKRHLRSDLARVTGMSEHPKEEQLWGYAWEEGHSSGEYEVAQIYLDLWERFFEE